MSEEVQKTEAEAETLDTGDSLKTDSEENVQIQDDCNFPIKDIDVTEKFIDQMEDGVENIQIDVEGHKEHLLHNMEKLKNDKDTCDVILRVKKGNYYWASFWAHKSVLAAYSPVFAESLKKFQTYGLPAVETVCRPNLVLPRKIHGAALAALVDWMYTGKLTVHRKALGHLPLVANYLKIQPIIDRLPQIFEDFKDAGVKLIDQKIEGEIEVGKENDDNEDQENETVETKTEDSKVKAEENNTEEKTSGPKKEWVINLWLKRQVAQKLPIIKPIPGFYIMLQSDVHRVKSSKGRKGSDPFDPPETIVDTNWLAAYNQFKAKQLHVKKESRAGRGGGRGGGNQQRGRGGTGNRGGYNHGNRGNSRGRGGNFGRGAFHGGYNGPPQRFNGPPRGRGSYGGPMHHGGPPMQHFNNGYGPNHGNYGPPRGGWMPPHRGGWTPPSSYNRGNGRGTNRGGGGPQRGANRGGQRGGRGQRGQNRPRPY